MSEENNLTIESVIEKINSLPNSLGIKLDAEEIDGIIIKQLPTSCVLGERQNSNQTHIAITGSQMNLFPSIYMPGYIEKNNIELKRYMYMYPQCRIYNKNMNYLDGTPDEVSDNKDEYKESKFSIIRSVRHNGKKGTQDQQIEIGHLSFSESQFVDFRKKLQTHDWLLMVKLLDRIEYAAFGIRDKDISRYFGEEDRKDLNGCFIYKKNSKSAVDIQQLTEVPHYHVEPTVNFPHNRILFGAPGTGKSYELRENQSGCFHATNMERVTFHPAYTYAQFFGSYKPVSENGPDGKDIIRYRFVCGPFLRVLLKALKNPSQNYLLIIEEINRADVAAVFGDVFQLLDRTDGRSDYEIDIPEDLSRYLASSKDYAELEEDKGILHDGKLFLPENLRLRA